MLLGTDVTLAQALALLVGCVAAWLALPHRLSVAPWVRARPALAIAFAAAVTRALPALLLDRGLPFDMEAHWWVGSLVLAGRDVYTAPLARGRYPYPPLHGLLSALLVLLSEGDRHLFLVLDKLAPALCGVALAVAVWALARRLGAGEGAAVLPHGRM